MLFCRKIIDMGKYFNIAAAGVLALLMVLLLYQASLTKRYRSLYYKARQNVEAYQAANSDLQETSKLYRMSMDDLRASKDKLDRKILEIVDSLKIKDKRIEGLQYQSSTASRVDTLVFMNTVFVENLKIDTLVGDEWYTMKLHMQYPSEVVVSPTFNSEQYVVINTKIFRKYAVYKGRRFLFFIPASPNIPYTTIYQSLDSSFNTRITIIIKWLLASVTVPNPHSIKYETASDVVLRCGPYFAILFASFLTTGASKFTIAASYPLITDMTDCDKASFLFTASKPLLHVV
jgi:hypothetical protein